jgi:hypothetical protein
MQIFSGEFVIFSVALFIIVRFKNRMLLTEKLLEGLKVYTLPSEDDVRN